jgi:hypothetical protein
MHSFRASPRSVPAAKVLKRRFEALYDDARVMSASSARPMSMMPSRRDTSCSFQIRQWGLSIGRQLAWSLLLEYASGRLKEI